MPRRNEDRFKMLTRPPAPLPDEEPAAAAEPRGRSAPGRTPASEPPTPKMPPAATTIRLRPAAAEPLNTAWLEERRRSNPKLSYPEFASMIVRLGLAAYEEQQGKQS